MKKIFPLLSIFFLFISGLKAQSGITWSAPLTVAGSSSGNEHPRIVLNAAGNPLILWGHVNRAMFSRWNGTSFTTPTMLNTAAIGVAGASWMGPDIASKGDTVYVVMKRIDEAIDTNRIFIVHSFDDGATFSAPVQLAFISDSLSRFPTVTIDDSGNPIVGFMKFDSSFTRSSWWVTKSSDYGMTFPIEVQASGWSGGDVCDCCPGSIISSGNTVAMLYRDKNNNIRDMWAGISHDGGNTFSTGFEVDNTNWLLNACPATGPDGFIIGDTLFSCWMSSASGTSLVYYSKSSISSLATPSAVPVTGMFSGLSVQNYPRMATNGIAVAMVWPQNVNGTDQLGMLFANNIYNGFPALYDTVAMNNITNADVAIGSGVVHVVWEDDNSGVVRYRRGTFNPVITSLTERNTADEEIAVYPNPFDDQLTIVAKSSEPLEIDIYDIASKKIMQQKFTTSLSLNTRQLAKGIYIYEVKNANGVIERGKIVKE